MKTTQLTKNDVEGARGEIFHMIIFAMAWVMIGEYALDFRDHVLAALMVLAAVVVLALYSIKLFDLEDSLPDVIPGIVRLERKQKRRASLYATIFILEGVAIMATWIILIRSGHENWVVPGFAAVAGLHFFPLARVIRVDSYYFLGTWICLLAVAGYLLVNSGQMPDYDSNALIAYGCAAGAVVDGIWIALKTNRRARQV
ncbi:hypothetical protein [Puia dinghuensis]|uniref:Uncharacterized protein n=1 Tax=Puia dinghuensis TaxID=1792502 RepID=A0A8J2UII9_9BACT|nr:hypothetical protein [Puia dinghuensis]GGB21058.1 hypothetical protein GCM10011511_51010 [Puia dinghuensis]